MMDCHMAADDKIDFLPKNRNMRVGLSARGFSKPTRIEEAHILTRLSSNHPQLGRPGQLDLGQELVL